MPIIPDTDPLDYGNRPGEGPLRPGGIATDLPGDPSNLPDKPNKAAAAQASAVAIVRDLWGGTETLHEKSTVYLPKAPGEAADAYLQRLRRSVFFNAFRRAVEGLTGLMFRRDPQLSKDVPPEIRGHWENIDLAGTHGDVFVRELVQDALTTGHAGILVDFPATGGQQTRADELPGSRTALRPYWVPIRKDDIVSWRTSNLDGYTVLTQLVIRECHQIPDGEFGEREQIRYRVLRRQPVPVQVAGEPTPRPVVEWYLMEVKDRRLFVVGEGYCLNQTEIPFAEVQTSGRRGLLDSDPPLIDLAHLNIAHYQQWSDAAHARYLSCMPTMFASGFELTDDAGNAVIVGPNNTIASPDPAGDLKWVAYDGPALEQCARAIEDLKSDMGTIGLAMLSPQKRSAETAEAKRLDKATSDSALAATARATQDAVERALGFHAAYLRLPDGGSVEVNRDFEGLLMDSAVMSAFASLISQGLPWDVALDQLQRGGRVAEDMDVEELALRIATERAASRDFMADQMQPRDDSPVEDERDQ